MLQRFYDASEDGLIQIDGIDIKNIHLKTLRETIGYVSQEPVLMIGTIRENLLFGNRDATEQDCVDALYQANAGFVFELEKGMDTYVGTAGIVNMSGGQK